MSNSGKWSKIEVWRKYEQNKHIGDVLNETEYFEETNRTDKGDKFKRFHIKTKTEIKYNHRHFQKVHDFNT